MILKKLTTLLDAASDNVWKRVDWHRRRFTEDLTDLFRRHFPTKTDVRLVSVVFLLETAEGKKLTLGAEPLRLQAGEGGTLVFKPWSAGSLTHVNSFGGPGVVLESFCIGQENLFAGSEPAPLEWIVLYNLLPIEVKLGIYITLNVKRLL